MCSYVSVQLYITSKYSKHVVDGILKMYKTNPTHWFEYIIVMLVEKNKNIHWHYTAVFEYGFC